MTSTLREDLCTYLAEFFL